MKKPVVLLLILVVIVAGFLLFRKYTNIPPGSWQWYHKNTTTPGWVPFTWTNDSFDGKTFERTAMMVPTQLEGVPGTFLSQLDLGSNITVLYENPMKKYPQLIAKSFYYRKHIFGGKKLKCLRDVKYHLGETTVKSSSVYVYENYGDTLTGGDDTKIGTIGIDMFKDKVLEIDFPHRRFRVLDEINDSTILFNPIELSAYGFILLPVRLGNRTIKCIYDSGSSLFPIITSPGHTGDFTNNPVTDSFSIGTWDGDEMVYSRNFDTTLEIAGHTFFNKKIYTIERSDKFLSPSHADAILGNALFWNYDIIIDLKHKRFGIR